MATKDPELIVKIVGDSAPLQNELKKAQQAAKTAGQTMAKAGEYAAQAFAAVATAAAGVSVVLGKLASDFEYNMAQVHTLVNATDEEMQKVSGSVLALGARMGQSTELMTRGLYDTVSAGIALGDSISFLELASKSAIAGATNTAVSVDALTSVVNSYGAALGENLTLMERSQRASDVIFATIREGKTTYEEMAGSLGRVASISAQVGVSFEEVGAALATLTKGGLKTDEAITAVRAVMVSVLKPSEDAAVLAQELGLDFSAAALKAKGLGQFLTEVKEAVGGDSEALTALFPNVRALAGVMNLAGSQAGEFNRILDSMATASGTTEAAFSKMARTTQFQLDVVQQSFINLGTAVGKELLGPFTEFIHLEQQSSGAALQAAASMKLLHDGAIMVGKAIFYEKSAVLEITAQVSNFALMASDLFIRATQTISNAWSTMITWILKGVRAMMGEVEDSMLLIGEYSSSALNVATAISVQRNDILKSINAREDELTAKIAQQNVEMKERQEWNSRFVKELKTASDENEKNAAAFGKQKKAIQEVAEVQKSVTTAQVELEEAKRGASISARNMEFANQQKINQHIEATTKFFEESLKTRTNTLVREIDKQKDAATSLQDKFRDIAREQSGQREGFQEQQVRIASAGLSSEGQAIQQGGLARYLQQQAQGAGASGDLQEQRRLLEKAQGIFGNLAEQGDNGAYQEFLKLQQQITQTFEQQKQANIGAQAAAREKVQSLSGDLERLFLEVDQALEIKVDTREAQTKLDELRSSFQAFRAPVEAEGYVKNTQQEAKGKNTAFGGVVVNLNISEKVDREMVRSVIIPEIEKATKRIFKFTGAGAL